jgi:RNA polymerase sigma-70 factor, ECF subfamily
MNDIQTRQAQQNLKGPLVSDGLLTRRLTPGIAPDGTSEAFMRWHQEYHDRLLLAVTPLAQNREIAEDIVSAAFMQALKNFDAFRGESSFYTWLHAIAFNEFLRYQRHERGISLDTLQADLPREMAEADGIGEAEDRSDCCQRLRRALRRLPAKYRRVLVEHFIRGYSAKRIAARQRIPFGTVLSRIHTAKRLLRRAWAWDTEHLRTGIRSL